MIKWLVIILVGIVLILTVELWAYWSNRTTLSLFVWRVSHDFPLLPFITGLIVGALAAHFWWSWCPA